MNGLLDAKTEEKLIKIAANVITSFLQLGSRKAAIALTKSMKIAECCEIRALYFYLSFYSTVLTPHLCNYRK